MFDRLHSADDLVRCNRGVELGERTRGVPAWMEHAHARRFGGASLRRGIRGGGGGDYDPGAEAGLLLDLWARPEFITEAGTGVSQWRDKKGGRLYVQGTDGKRPSYEANGLGGRPSVLFIQANADVLTLASGLTSTTKNYVLICSVDPVTNNTLDYVIDSQTGRVIFFLGGQTLANVGYFDGAFREIAAATLPPQILRWKLTNGGNGQVWRGNTSLGTAAYTGTDLGGNSSVGGRFDAADGFCDARYGRIMLFETLDDTRDARVMQWMSSHYGIGL